MEHHFDPFRAGDPFGDVGSRVKNIGQTLVRRYSHFDRMRGNHSGQIDTQIRYGN
jgi:hypothetical protein